MCCPVQDMLIGSRIDQHFPGGSLVVDLGCGDGRWIDSARARYARAVGIDVSRARLTSQTGPIEGWEFVQADLNEGVPLLASCADAVLANQVIEHIANPMQFINEVARVLRPGAVFVATTPNIRYLRHLARLVVRGSGPVTSGEGLRTVQVWDDGHIHFFTAHDLEWLAHKAGFSDVHTEALIDLGGRGSRLRRVLDHIRGHELVKGFLSGNVMLVARK